MIRSFRGSTNKSFKRKMTIVSSKTNNLTMMSESPPRFLTLEMGRGINQTNNTFYHELFFDPFSVIHFGTCNNTEDTNLININERLISFRERTAFKALAIKHQFLFCTSNQWMLSNQWSLVTAPVLFSTHIFKGSVGFMCS